MSKKSEKKGMNLPNKITCVRLVISFMVLFILCMDWSLVGLDPEFATFNLEGVDPISLRYIICGVLFLIGSVTDFLDGYFARKYNMITDFGKVMDAIADKVLVNGVLIILACGSHSMIPLIVPVIIITRDIVVDSIKMASGSKGRVVAASWSGKVKTVCMMIGVTLTFFYNLPFEFIGLNIADLFIYVATIMSVVSACQYYLVNKDFIFSEM